MTYCHVALLCCNTVPPLFVSLCIGLIVADENYLLIECLDLLVASHIQDSRSDVHPQDQQEIDTHQCQPTKEVPFSHLVCTSGSFFNWFLTTTSMCGTPTTWKVCQPPSSGAGGDKTSSGAGRSKPSSGADGDKSDAVEQEVPPVDNNA